jgi:predicted nucleic acid-binding protein
LRIFDVSDVHHQSIRQALRLLKSQQHTLVTSWQNVAEFWNVSTRPKAARGGYGQSVEKTERRVRFIERFGPILCESSAAFEEWRRLVVTSNVTGVAVHDARLVAIMRTHNIAHFVTLNVHDLRRYSVNTALTPQDIVARGVASP